MQTKVRVEPTPPRGKPSPPGRAVVNGSCRDERTRDIPQSHPRTLVSSAKPTTGIQVVWLPTPPVPRLAHSGCPQSRITSSSLTGKEVFPKAVWPVRVRKFPSMSMKRRATRLVAVRVFCLLWHLRAVVVATGQAWVKAPPQQVLSLLTGVRVLVQCAAWI